MNTNFVSKPAQPAFSSLFNGLVTGVFTFAVVAAAGFMTFIQFIAIA
jgi:hypothetical protein